MENSHRRADSTFVSTLGNRHKMPQKPLATAESGIF
jgi:hypothetical protein